MPAAQGQSAGVPPLTVLRQTLHLMGLFLRMRVRNPMLALTELLFPVLVVLAFCFLFTNMERDYTSGDGYDLYDEYPLPPIGVTSEDTTAPTAPPAGKLWFSFDAASSGANDTEWALHGRAIFEAVVERMAREHHYYERGGQIEWYNDTNQMASILCAGMGEESADINAEMPHAAVIFSRTSHPPHQSCMSMNAAARAADFNSAPQLPGIHYIIFQKGLPSANMLFGSMKAYKPSPTLTYASGGALSLQLALDRALAHVLYDPVHNTSLPEEYRIRRFPSMQFPTLSWGPEIKRMNARDAIVRRAGAPMLALSYIVVFTVTMVVTVTAHEIGLKDCLTALGMSPIAHGAAYVSTTLIVNFVPVVLQVLLLFRSETLINIQTSFFLMYLMVFLLSVIAAGQLVGVFFRNPSYVSVLSVVMWASVIAVGAKVADCDQTVSYDGKESSCQESGRSASAGLLSPVAFILGFREIVLRVNDQGQRVGWETLDAAKPSHDTTGSYDLTVTMGMMLGDAALYFILAWYFKRASYNGHQICFPFKSSYWRSGVQSECPTLLSPTADREPVKLSQSGGSLLQIRGLTACARVGDRFEVGIFSRENVVLDNVDLDVHSDQILAVLGNEGKSEFVACLSGQKTPEAGKFFMDGVPTTPLLHQYRMKIGLGPQRNVLYDCLTACEHLELVGVLKGIPWRQVQAEAEAMAAEVDLLKDQKQAKDFTPGQKRKLQTAMALIGDPRLVILDEPTVDMDPVSMRQIRNLIRKFKRGRIVIIATKSIVEAEWVADRIAVLLSGKVRCIGSSAFLKRKVGCGYLINVAKRHTLSISPLLTPTVEDDGVLVQLLESTAPNAYVRESNTDIRIHIPSRYIQQLIAMLRLLESRSSPCAKMIKSWALKAHGLEDIYLHFLEEAITQVACVAGHILEPTNRDMVCSGTADAPCGRRIESLFTRFCCSRKRNRMYRCNACNTFHCEACGNENKRCYALSRTSVRPAAQVSPSEPGTTFKLSQNVDGMWSSVSQPTPLLVTPMRPSKFATFWEDTNLEDHIANEGLDFARTRTRASRSRLSRDSFQLGPSHLQVPSAAVAREKTSVVKGDHPNVLSPALACIHASQAAAFSLQVSGVTAASRATSMSSSSWQGHRAERLPMTPLLMPMSAVTAERESSLSASHPLTSRRSPSAPSQRDGTSPTPTGRGDETEPLSAGSPVHDPLHGRGRRKTAPVGSISPVNSYLSLAQRESGYAVNAYVIDDPMAESGGGLDDFSGRQRTMTGPSGDEEGMEMVGVAQWIDNTAAEKRTASVHSAAGSIGSGSSTRHVMSTEDATSSPDDDAHGKLHGVLHTDVDLPTTPVDAGRSLSWPTDENAGEAGNETYAADTTVACEKPVVDDVDGPTENRHDDSRVSPCDVQIDVVPGDGALAASDMAHQTQVASPTTPSTPSLVIRSPPEGSLEQAEWEDSGALAIADEGILSNADEERESVVPDDGAPDACESSMGGTTGGGDAMSFPEDLRIDIPPNVYERRPSLRARAAAQSGSTPPPLAPLPRPEPHTPASDAGRSHRSDESWEDVGGSQHLLPDVIFTPGTLGGACPLRQLCALVQIKRSTVARRNRHNLIFHLLFPLLFILAGILVLEFLGAGLRDEPSITIKPTLIAPPWQRDDDLNDTTAYVHVPMLGMSALLDAWNTLCLEIAPDDCVYMPQVSPGADAVRDITLNSSGSAPLGGVVQADGGEPVIWYNASALHVLPAMANIIGNLELQAAIRASADEGAFTGVPRTAANDNQSLPLLRQALRRLVVNRTQIHTTVHTVAEGRTENAVPVLAFSLLAAFGMSFITSSFAVQIVVERRSGFRLLQQTAGLSTFVYWLSHYIWDTIVSAVLSAIITALYLIFYPSLRTTGSVFAMVIVTLLYFQAGIPIVYTIAQFLTTPWRAQAMISAVLIIGMLIPLILSVSISSSGGTFLNKFETLSVFVFNPLYSLINAWLTLTGHVTSENREDVFASVRNPAWGLMVAYFVGWSMLALVEARRLLLTRIKQFFPRPPGFYVDDSGVEVVRNGLEGDDVSPVEQERREVERLRLGGKMPAHGVVIYQMRKLYRTGQRKIAALQSIDLLIPPGEVFALLGPTGAGKTTTTRLLTGEMAPTQGDAFVDGKSLLGGREHLWKSMGVCLQNIALIDELTVDQHVHLFAVLKGIPHHQMQKVIAAFLHALDLYRHRADPVSGLSESTCKRVCLLLAFLGRPNFLILDEPTSRMDLLSRKCSRNFMLQWMKQARSSSKFCDARAGGSAKRAAMTAACRELQRPPIIFLTTHSLEEVQLIATRVGILVQGKLRKLGKLKHLCEKYGSSWSLAVRASTEVNCHAFTKCLQQMAPEAQIISSRSGSNVYSIPKHVKISEIFTLVERNMERFQIEDYGVNHMSLEEVFFQTVLDNDSQRMRFAHTIPPMRIVMLIVGTRGDVQPFLALALGLASEGHHVRLATHAKFKTFVEDEVSERLDGNSTGQVEFFPLAGDPNQMMAFMVENPDCITLDINKIKANQEMMGQIFKSCWAACSTPSDYVVDVVIANPPTQCHPHIVEKLQADLQVHFTMPFSATAMYPNPFAATDKLGNYKSHALVEKLWWMGLGTQINHFRTHTLGLPAIGQGDGLAAKMEVPHIYCMSEYVLKRPSDWGQHIHIAGNWFLPPKPNYAPPEAVAEFVYQGTPPLYIGFGSIVLPASSASFMASMAEGIDMLLMKHVALRVILHTSSGQNGVAPKMSWPSNRLLILQEPVDHAWLFPLCCTVVHHGGAGTVAAGLSAGCPAVVIPFFGDQHFWGKTLEEQGCGVCLQQKDLTAASFCNAVIACLDPRMLSACEEMGRKLREEDGVAKGIAAFYSHLPLVEVQLGCDTIYAWEVCCYENQRFYPCIGWTDTLLPSDPLPWCCKNGKLSATRYDFRLPKGWKWISDWHVDKDRSCDAAGFQYASSWDRVFHNRRKVMDFVRQRRWVRRRIFSPTERTDTVEFLHNQVGVLQTMLKQKQRQVDALRQGTLHPRDVLSSTYRPTTPYTPRKGSGNKWANLGA